MGMTIDKYINALRKCAKEHENDRTFTGHIIVSDLCRDTANLLEELEQEPATKNGISNKSIIYKAKESKEIQEDLEKLEKLNEPKNDLRFDCISRQEVLRLLANSIGKTNTYLQTAVLKMSSVTPQEPRWIPVSERLPKAGEYVGNIAKYYLVQNEYGDMLVARYTHSEYWEQIYQLKPYADEIVAWMPLPKAHREVKE